MSLPVSGQFSRLMLTQRKEPIQNEPAIQAFTKVSQVVRNQQQLQLKDVKDGVLVPLVLRGGPRTAATSKMEQFVKIVNEF